MKYNKKVKFKYRIENVRGEVWKCDNFFKK